MLHSPCLMHCSSGLPFAFCCRACTKIYIFLFLNNIDRPFITIDDRAQLPLLRTHTVMHMLATAPHTSVLTCAMQLLRDWATSLRDTRTLANRKQELWR
jgi:hypothetical protein